MTDTKEEQPGARRRVRPTSPRANSARKAGRAARTASVEDACKLALVVAAAALEKKALAVEILDVVGKVDYADYLVLMTGRSNRHVDSLAQEIEAACAKKKRRALSIEGTSNASWVLIDFGDIVVHIFQEEARGLYDIEGLWLDAKRLPVPGQNT
jgi:ribosome-associated protein